MSWLYRLSLMFKKHDRQSKLLAPIRAARYFLRNVRTKVSEGSSEEGAAGKQSLTVPAFWYSRNQALLLMAGLFLLTRVFGGVTAPFQSPDEFNHLKRAYLLSTAVLITDNRGPLSGGLVDKGLLQYMDCFTEIPNNYSAKVSRSEIRSCNEIHFADKRIFSDLDNTAMYFPFLYTPQAVALLIGEKFRLTVANSYYLARLFSSCAALALLLAALMIYPAPPSVLALFTLPMCVFQLSSASLDGMTFATTVLAASIFLRGCDKRLEFNSRLHFVLAACVFSLSTARDIYIVLTPLLALLYKARRSPSYIISFLTVLCLSLVWIIFALKAVHGQGAIVQQTSTPDILRYYGMHPGTFLAVVVRTLTEDGVIRSYWRMFVGSLGSLDTPVASAAYIVFAFELLAIALVSTSAASLRSLNTANLVLACAAVASTLLLFLVALSAWTAHPATFIERMSGRYFYPGAFLFLFASTPPALSRTGVALSYALLILMGISSVEFAVPALVDRYYTH